MVVILVQDDKFIDFVDDIVVGVIAVDVEFVEIGLVRIVVASFKLKVLLGNLFQRFYQIVFEIDFCFDFDFDNKVDSEFGVLCQSDKMGLCSEYFVVWVVVFVVVVMVLKCY